MELRRAVYRGSTSGLEALLAGSRPRFDRQAKDDALLAAVWRDHIGAIEALLAEGASPDAQDDESGWSSLHRALYWGHLGAAALLLEAGASLHAPDHKGRSPLDCLSRDLACFLPSPGESEVYSWGNGANYQLGTGAEGLQLAPVRLEALRGSAVVAVAAAKFHSAAVTADGRLLTWGFGRGGRLGHPEFHVHSGQSAVICPRPLAAFARRRVAAVAAAKHHTAAVTEAGELYTWGSNRDGRLGYPAGDTQPTPRKITAFNRQRVAAVAVANRHTVALLEGGAVFSWGSNLQGQLGYGTADSASNPVPRVVEAMKGKHVTQVSAAKRHTLALTRAGEVWTWGHRVVTPKRVQLAGARDTGLAGGRRVAFHCGQAGVSRPAAGLVAAGAAHSAAVTTEGAVLAWRSADPALRPQEVGGALAGRRVVAIAAGKYRTAVVTSEGDCYMWEGWSKAGEAVPRRGMAQPLTPPPPLPAPGSSPSEQQDWEGRGGRQRRAGQTGALAFQRISPQRVEGVKRAVGVAVGEKHSLALQSWACAPLWEQPAAAAAAGLAAAEGQAQLSPRGSASSAIEDSDCAGPRPGSAAAAAAAAGLLSEAYWGELEAAAEQPAYAFASPERPAQQRRPDSAAGRRPGPPSLQRLCERRVAAAMVEPRSVLQVLEWADAAGAPVLRRHCLAVALANLDLVLLEARQQLEQLPPHLLQALGCAWGQRFPRAVPVPPACGSEAPSPSPPRAGNSGTPPAHRSFVRPLEEAAAAGRARQERTIRKKLQQIEALRARTDAGPLDAQQLAKLALKPTLLAAMEALQAGRPLEEVREMLAAGQASASAAESPHAVSSPAAVPGGGRRPRRRSKGGGTSSLGSSPAPAVSATPDTASSERSRLRAEAAALPPSVPRVAGFAQEAASAPAAAASASSPAQAAPSSSSSPLPSLPEEQQQPAAARRPEPLNPKATPAKKPARRKGGLSMFLAGQLEQPQQPPAAAVASQQQPERASPLTWALQAGGAAAAPASLSDILSQEAAQSSAAAAARQQPPGSSERPAGRPPARPSDEGEAPAGGGSLAVPLGDWLRKSKPQPIAGARQQQQQQQQARGPAWGPRGGSPSGAAATRLQDIQAEQEQARGSLSRSWGASGASPGSSLRSSATQAAPTPWRAHIGFGASSPGAAFPAGTSPGSGRRVLPSPQPPASKWFIPEEPEIVPLQSIQTEESAIKQLQALYGEGNVRLAPKQKLARS